MVNDRLEKAVGEDELARQVSALISRATGIQLGESQLHMVKLRLRQRFNTLKLGGWVEYPEFFNANFEKEMRALISLLTTHHTYFFREFSHFDYLEGGGLLEIVNAARKEGRRELRVWSAACSRGQEVWSLAMFLDLKLRQIAPEMKFTILGTDVDHECIALAQNGVYEEKEIATVPLMYRGTHWARGTGEISKFYKIKKSLRDRCTFRVHNLLDAPYFHEKFDLIFCRNVFIYFAQSQIREVTSELLKVLAPHGRLFFGLSESMLGQSLPIRLLDSSIYTHEAAPAQTIQSRHLRVLCVDDSNVILTLLKHILSKDDFEVVGVAKNGIEAAKVLASTSVDVMTLDIHMPEMNGVEYLRQHFGPNHPPVVVISSLAREENALAKAALKFGASDYVEKPSYSNLVETSEQIRAKLRSAHRFAHVKLKRQISAVQNALEFDRSRLIALGASTGGTEALKLILTSLPPMIPPILIVQHIPHAFSLAFANHLAELCPFEVKEAEDGDVIQPDRVLIAPGGKQMTVIKSGSGFKVRVVDDRTNKHRPSVDVLFHSIAEHVGGKAVGAILTGMGDDGAQGLLSMKRSGAQTFVQSEKSSIVFGMPREALALGGADIAVDLENIAAHLSDILRRPIAA